MDFFIINHFTVVCTNVSWIAFPYYVLAFRGRNNLSTHEHSKLLHIYVRINQLFNYMLNGEREVWWRHVLYSIVRAFCEKMPKHFNDY